MPGQKDGWKDRRMKGQKGRQTLFHRTLPATAMGISKCYWKIRKNDLFCFHNFRGVIATQGIICHPGVRKVVIKLQQILSKHKQAFIPTAI